MYTSTSVTQSDRRSICGHSACSEAGLTAFCAHLFSSGSQRVQGNGLFAYLPITCKTYERFHFLQNVSDLLNSPFLRVLRDRFSLSRKKQYTESKKSNLQNCNSKVSTTWIHNISEPKTSLKITLLSHWGHRILDFQIFFFVKWPVCVCVCVCVCSVVSDSL